MSALEQAKAAFTIDDAWSRLGLPGHPSKSCRSPFREDRSPSFSVFDNGTRWRDHGTGEGGDVCDFLAAALNVDPSNAARWLLEQTNTRTSRREWPRVRTPLRANPKPAAAHKPLVLPPMDKGTIAELAQLQRQRGFQHFAGLQVLLDRGQLGFANLADGNDSPRCWIITDDSRKNAQARRLDGLPWQGLPGHPKAKTFPRSQAAWPIGASRIHFSNTILFIEGAPDLLAAATLAAFELQEPWETVCMIGAGLRIPEDALSLFEGKTVFLFVHNDQPGIEAARRWHGQLTEAGATVTALSSDTEGRDLNDALTAGEAISIH